MFKVTNDQSPTGVSWEDAEYSQAYRDKDGDVWFLDEDSKGCSYLVCLTNSSYVRMKEEHCREIWKAYSPFTPFTGTLAWKNNDA